jgi:cationic peptide transport system ATP-binding protein
LGPRCPNARKECVKVPEQKMVHQHSYSCHFPLHSPVDDDLETKQ